MFETRIISGKGDDVGAIIAQAVADNPLTAGTMGVKAFEAILRRAAGATGSALFREVKKAFTRANPYGLAPMAVHPSGKKMSPLIENNFRRKRGIKPYPKNYDPGRGFKNLMQYRMSPDKKRGEPNPPGAPNIEVGLIPERRGGKKWADRFRNWQTGHDIIYPERDRAMRAMLAALGIPIRSSRILKAPSREVISKVEQKENPLDLFRKNLYERLER